MNRELQVETRILKGDHVAIGEQITKCKEELERLREVLDELNTMWNGRASMAFYAAGKKDTNTVEKLLQRLLTMHNALNEAGMKYEKTEQQLKDQFESIKL